MTRFLQNITSSSKNYITYLLCMADPSFHSKAGGMAQMCIQYNNNRKNISLDCKMLAPKRDIG